MSFEVKFLQASRLTKTYSSGVTIVGLHCRIHSRLVLVFRTRVVCVLFLRSDLILTLNLGHSYL